MVNKTKLTLICFGFEVHGLIQVGTIRGRVESVGFFFFMTSIIYLLGISSSPNKISNPLKKCVLEFLMCIDTPMETGSCII